MTWKWRYDSQWGYDCMTGAFSIGTEDIFCQPITIDLSQFGQKPCTDDHEAYTRALPFVEAITAAMNTAAVKVPEGVRGYAGRGA